MPTKHLMVQKGLYNINKSYLPFYLFLNGISSTFKYTFGNTADIFCKRNTSPKYSNPSGHPANSTGDLQWQSAATPHGKKTGCQTHFTEHGVDPEEARWGKRPSVVCIYLFQSTHPGCELGKVPEPVSLQTLSWGKPQYIQNIPPTCYDEASGEI